MNFIPDHYANIRTLYYVTFDFFGTVDLSNTSNILRLFMTKLKKK